MSKHRLSFSCIIDAVVVSASVWIVQASLPVSMAAEPAVAKPAANFTEILDSYNRASLRAVGEYVAKNPKADDLELAYRWAFVTATNFELEPEILQLAEGYLKRDAEGQESRGMAQRVLGVGLARSGKLRDAIGVFQSHMQTADIRNPGDSVEFAEALGELTQLHDDVPATKEVFDTLMSRMLLNGFVREHCELRMSHLELAKKSAPPLGVTDLDGKPVSLSDYKGKVLLIDFWQTTCAPCLEQFPALKQLYQELHGKGFEVVGISLDEDRASVDQFQKESKLPWRLALSQSDRDETRTHYRADKIPTTFLVDQKGQIAYVDLHDNQLRQGVEKLLRLAK